MRHDPFEALDDADILRPFALPLEGDPAELAAIGPRLTRAPVTPSATLSPLPSPQQPAAWEALCERVEVDGVAGHAVISHALRCALAHGAARLACADGHVEIVRLPAGSAIFAREGSPPIFANDVVVTGSPEAWDAIFARQPALLDSLDLRGAPEGIRAVLRFALRDVAREGEGGAWVAHESARRRFADWLWCGHRVWGTSMLVVTYDATHEAVAAHFAGYLLAREAEGSPRSEWGVGVAGSSLILRRTYDEPSSSWQVQWEWWALSRALAAPFAVLMWEVTETEMGGLDAWGRDDESLRRYLAPDATEAQRDALREGYRARSEREVVIPSGAAWHTEGALWKPVYDALGGTALARPSRDDLTALARSGARAAFPARLVLSLESGSHDDRVWPVLSALSAATCSTVRFVARWR